ncbi:unnamed protein product [Ascophyllum nodosum]
MPSVRQKKAGIRAVSSTPEGSAAAAASAATPVLSTDVPQAVSRPQRSPKPTLPKVPATAAVVGSARNKGKRSPSATPTTTVARSGGIASSPTQTRLIGGHTDNRVSAGSPYGRQVPGSGLEKSLRETVRQVLLSDVVRMDGGGNGVGAGGSGGGDAWRVMVLDSRATRVISSVVGMYDIMEGHVTVVEDLHKIRQPFPEMEGVYVVAPTAKSIEAIKRDFKSPSEALYSKVHLFFLRGLTRELVNSIKQCPTLISRVKTFKARLSSSIEINMDYLVPEIQSYHFDMGSFSGKGEVDPETHYRELYGGVSERRVMDTIASRLVTLCATLGEFPHVRYAADGVGRTEGVARMFQQESMQQFVSNSPTWSFRGQDSRSTDGGRATLLLLDRADDLLSPLMHEFTYQCLVEDLLGITDGKVSYKAETGRGVVQKEALLTDSDSLWAEFRHQHIGKVLTDLGNRFRDLVASNAGAAALVKGEGRQMSVEQMAKATRGLPEFQEVSKKMSQHVRLSQDCMTQLEKNYLLQAGALEQTMVLGTDELGKSRKCREILEGWSVEDSDRQPGLLKILESSTSEETKVRLVGIFNITQTKATHEDKERVTRKAQLASTSVPMLSGMEKLVANAARGAGTRAGAGGSVAAVPGSSGGGTGETATKLFKMLGFGNTKQEETNEFTHMRYVTPLKMTLTKMLSGELSLSAFPSLLPMPSSDQQDTRRKAATRSIRKSGGGQETVYSGARVIVFVIGGVCHSEIRAAYEAMHAFGREVIVGGSTFLPPSGFLQGLTALA